MLKGLILASFAPVLWGASGTFGQFLFQQRNINVEWLIIVRMLISGLVLLFIGILAKNVDLGLFREIRKMLKYPF